MLHVHFFLIITILLLQKSILNIEKKKNKIKEKDEKIRKLDGTILMYLIGITNTYDF